MSIGYNIKIVRTANYYEVWEYEKPIFSSRHLDDIVSEDNKNPNKKRRTFEELSVEEQETRLARMKQTRLTTKHKLKRLIDCNFDNKTSFLTLTTKDNITDRDDFTLLFKNFVKRYNYSVFKTKKSRLKYVAVLEQQGRGAWHAHAILFSVPFVPHSELLELWGIGAVRINKLNHLDDSANAGRYVVKYMEKGIGEGLLENFGKNSYLASRNLKKPTETKVFTTEKFEVNSDDIIFKSTYVSKIYNKHGDYIDNPVTYRKIKIND